MSAATAFIVGLERTDGHVTAVRVRCTWCRRVHVHSWPVRGPVAPPCGTQRSYTVTFHTPTEKGP